MLERLMTRKEVAEYFHCSENTVREMELSGVLERVKDAPGCLYRERDVAKIARGGDASPLTAWERDRMETEIATLRGAIKTLQEQLHAISTAAQMGLTETMKVGGLG